MMFSCTSHWIEQFVNWCMFVFFVRGLLCDILYSALQLMSTIFIQNHSEYRRTYLMPDTFSVSTESAKGPETSIVLGDIWHHTGSVKHNAYGCSVRITVCFMIHSEMGSDDTSQRVHCTTTWVNIVAII